VTHFVDIWQGNLALDVQSLDKLIVLLDQQELARARAFKLPAVRDRFVATRGLLRTILARYLQVDPAGLQFTAGEYGKPALSAEQLYFNLSHTADSLVIVVSDLENIGVDIERIKPRSSLPQLARRCFSKAEFNAWHLFSESQRQQVFYKLWTQKEAFVKAVGRGVALGLDRCEVDLAGSGFLKVPQEYGLAENWRIIEFFLNQDLCGAVVAPNVEFVPSLRRIDIDRMVGLA
jgi:4'-phosphopantetheinyl transferase